MRAKVYAPASLADFRKIISGGPVLLCFFPFYQVFSLLLLEESFGT